MQETLRKEAQIDAVLDTPGVVWVAISSAQIAGSSRQFTQKYTNNQEKHTKIFTNPTVVILKILQKK